jgi:hypothetical protein
MQVTKSNGRKFQIKVSVQQIQKETRRYVHTASSMVKRSYRRRFRQFESACLLKHLKPIIMTAVIVISVFIAILAFGNAERCDFK